MAGRWPCKVTRSPGHTESAPHQPGLKPFQLPVPGPEHLQQNQHTAMVGAPNTCSTPQWSANIAAWEKIKAFSMRPYVWSCGWQSSLLGFLKTRSCFDKPLIPCPQLTKQWGVFLQHHFNPDAWVHGSVVILPRMSTSAPTCKSQTVTASSKVRRSTLDSWLVAS